MALKHIITDGRFHEWGTPPYVEVEEHDNGRTATLSLWADVYDESHPDAPHSMTSSDYIGRNYIGHSSNGRTVPVDMIRAQALHLFTLLDEHGTYVYASKEGGNQ